LPLSLWWVLAPIAAAIPGLLSWHWGDQVARYQGDPLFSERFWAYRKNLTFVTVFLTTVISASITLGRPGVLVVISSIVTLLLGLSIGSFLTRKQVFQETWTFRTFVWFRFRLLVAVGGFWLLLMGAPFLVSASGNAAVAVAVAASLAAILLLWSAYYSHALISILGGRPIDDPAITSGLTRLLAATALTRPVLVQIGPAGGVLANAIALPSLSGHAVVFFRTVIDRFPASEVLAILAHELAHLEQYNARVLRQHRLFVWTFVVLGLCAMPLLIPRLGGGISALVWFSAGFAALSYLGRGRKQRETDGDKRAAELTGDPEALVAALTRLHSIGRVPRRWDAATEARSTHPALARRIQALRAPAGQGEPAATAVVRARTAGEFLVFESDRLRYLQEVAAEEGADLSWSRPARRNPSRTPRLPVFTSCPSRSAQKS
jgi:Zn-dependent protease with chaperone function